MEPSAQTPHHFLAVHPSNDDEIKRYQRALEQIFAALREEGAALSGYALIDADKGKPQPSAENPQDHIRFIQLECHESENLYLSDEVLTIMGTDWAIARAKIIAEAGNYGNKAEKLLGTGDWNRKTEDIKSIVNELNTILDP